MTLVAPPVVTQKESAAYPTRVVNLINPFAPGASTDIVWDAGSNQNQMRSTLHAPALQP